MKSKSKRCPATGKVMMTEADARSAAAGFRRDGHASNAYPCKKCGSWHSGSLPLPTGIFVPRPARKNGRKWE